MADFDEKFTTSFECDDRLLRRVTITGDTVQNLIYIVERMYTELDEFILKCIVVLPDQGEV